MLGGIAAETVDAEILHPSGQPVDDVVGRSALAALAPVFEIGQTVIVPRNTNVIVSINDI